MADIQSAEFFRRMFERLAENPTKDHKEIASELFNEAHDYDFCWEQMDADQALIDLELAVIKLDEDGEEIIIYQGESDDFLLFLGVSNISDRVRCVNNDNGLRYSIINDPSNLFSTSQNIDIEDHKLGTLVTIEDLETIIRHMKEERNN